MSSVSTTPPATQPLPISPTFSVALDPATTDQLAAAIALRVAELIPDPEDAGWLDAPAAARYLGITTTALHKLTAARELVFSQAMEGGRCYFRRSDLDAYRLQFVKGG
jgi:Helix-turn-helix domain